MMILDIIGLISIGLSLSFIIANIIANKNFPIISIVLFIIVGSAYAIKFFSKVNYIKYLQGIKNIEKYYVVGALFLVLVSFIFFLIQTIIRKREINLLKNGIAYPESNYVALLTKSNKVIVYSKKLDEIFKMKNEKGKLNLKEVYVDTVKHDLKKLDKLISTCNNKIDEVVNFKFVYSNSFEIEMNLIKKVVLNNNRKCGYVLLDNTISNSYKSSLGNQFKKNLFIYFDLFNEMIAYYDNDEKNYILTDSLVETLCLKNNRIDVNGFKTFIHKDDISAFDTKLVEQNKVNNVYFRIKTKNDYLWFQESNAIFNNSTYTIIKRVDITASSKVSFGNYMGLVKHVTKLTEDKFQFGVIMISTTNLLKLSEKMNKDFSNILVNKYFNTISNNILNDNSTFYKIGSIEYAIVIENIDQINVIIRGLQNNTSELLHQDILINKVNYNLECQLGIVTSNEFNSLDSRSIIKAAFDCLREATDPEFSRNYSLYQDKEKVKAVYNLKELGINLDDDLTEFEEDVEQ